MEKIINSQDNQDFHEPLFLENSNVLRGRRAFDRVGSLYNHMYIYIYNLLDAQNQEGQTRNPVIQCLAGLNNYFLF